MYVVHQHHEDWDLDLDLDLMYMSTLYTHHSTWYTHGLHGIQFFTICKMCYLNLFKFIQIYSTCNTRCV
jgi:hypothetical protein